MAMTKQVMTLALMAICVVAMAMTEAASKPNFVNVFGSSSFDDQMERLVFVQPRKQLAQQRFDVGEHDLITKLVLYNQNIKDYGATVEIIDGGIGHNFVEVLFKSKQGSGINYLIEIYTQQYSDK